MDNDHRITRLTAKGIDLRVGTHCDHIEEVTPTVYIVYGWREGCVVLVDITSGAQVEWEAS